jgi:hypothetical protein
MRSRRLARISGRIPAVLALGLLLFLASAAGAAEPPAREALSGWRYVQEVTLPAERTARLDDFVLGPAVFDGARADVGDLRLYDPAGREVPYALRVRRQDVRREPIAAGAFNRSTAPGEISEVAFDLGENPGEHNDVEVALPGMNYRRHARLEGSSDGHAWRLLVEKDLIAFRAGHGGVDDRQLVYPPSRFRYLRVQVERDPKVDERAVEIAGVLVRHQVEVPGEYLDQPVTVGAREAVRTDSGPGSAWILELGGGRVPCERLSVEVSDEEFARNYRVEAGGPADDPEGSQPFQQVASGLWRRRAGEPHVPLVAEFTEVTASRFRLMVTDDRNPPLNVVGATTRAAARQVVFADPGAGVSRLKLYYGNPRAQPPVYDFARNLPETIEPPPARAALAERRENPGYLPEPRPFTERWPWLIHLVLGVVCLGLGIILVSLGRAAVRLHDERPAMAAAEAEAAADSPG